MVTVSIITPSYNQANFIRATIDSVLTQTYSDIEYLVVDGSSTDDTVQRLTQVNDPRMTWFSEPDRGQADAINKGIQRTHGDILTFINSDDLLYSNAVEIAVSYFEEHPTVDALFSDGEFINEHGKRLSGFTNRPFNLSHVILGNGVAQPGTFWKRRVVEKIGLFDTSLHYQFDADYWIRMSLAGMLLDHKRGCRAAYRLHPQSKTVSQFGHFLGDWEAIMTKVFEREDIPISVQSLKPAVDEYLEWHKLKARWLNGDKRGTREGLRTFMSGKRKGRSFLATTMLIDSYLNTPLTTVSAKLYDIFTGARVLNK